MILLELKKIIKNSLCGVSLIHNKSKNLLGVNFTLEGLNQLKIIHSKILLQCSSSIKFGFTLKSIRFSTTQYLVRFTLSLRINKSITSRGSWEGVTCFASARELLFVKETSTNVYRTPCYSCSHPSSFCLTLSLVHCIQYIHRAWSFPPVSSINYSWVVTLFASCFSPQRGRRDRERTRVPGDAFVLKL